MWRIKILHPLSDSHYQAKVEQNSSHPTAQIGDEKYRSLFVHGYTFAFRCDRDSRNLSRSKERYLTNDRNFRRGDQRIPPPKGCSHGRNSQACRFRSRHIGERVSASCAAARLIRIAKKIYVAARALRLDSFSFLAIPRPSRKIVLSTSVTLRYARATIAARVHLKNFKRFLGTVINCDNPILLIDTGYLKIMGREELWKLFISA